MFPHRFVKRGHLGTFILVPCPPLFCLFMFLVPSQLFPYSLPMSPWSWTLLVPSQHWCHPPCPPSTVQLIKLLERRLSSYTLLTRPGVYLLCGKLHLYIALKKIVKVLILTEMKGGANRISEKSGIAKIGLAPPLNQSWHTGGFDDKGA